MENEIRYADLFGGVGGFRKGIEQSGANAKCVFYSDIDKYSVQTYNKNFKENHKPTDITKIRTDDIPEIDMLCGGFPCQAFSIAGKRRGFNDTRGTLFFEIARIIKAKRPKIIFLENVKGLLNHNKGETFRKSYSSATVFDKDDRVGIHEILGDIVDYYLEFKRGMMEGFTNGN